MQQCTAKVDAIRWRNHIFSELISPESVRCLSSHEILHGNSFKERNSFRVRKSANELRLKTSYVLDNFPIKVGQDFWFIIFLRDHVNQYCTQMRFGIVFLLEDNSGILFFTLRRKLKLAFTGEGGTKPQPPTPFCSLPAPALFASADTSWIITSGQWRNKGLS